MLMPPRKTLKRETHVLKNEKVSILLPHCKITVNSGQKIILSSLYLKTVPFIIKLYLMFSCLLFHPQAFKTDRYKLCCDVHSLCTMSDLFKAFLLRFKISLPQAYNIHVNGVLHCRVRYSQLLGLHEQVSLKQSQFTRLLSVCVGPEVTGLHTWRTEHCVNATISAQRDLSFVFVPHGRYASDPSV